MSAAARLLTAAAFTLMGAAQAMAVGAGFSVHWMVTTDDRELRFGSGNDWSARMNFGSAQIQRDTLVLYEHWFASDVRTTGLSLTKESDYYERYERSLRTMLDQRVPQGFDGYVCLDIEFLPTYYGQRTGGPNLYPTTG